MKKRGPKGPTGHRLSNGRRSMTHKQCWGCKRDLPLEDFAKRGHGKPHHLCQKCNTDHTYRALWRRRMKKGGREVVTVQIRRMMQQLEILREVEAEGVENELAQFRAQLFGKS